MLNRRFKDLNLNLPVHPNTSDLTFLRDEEAVKRSVKNIIMTNIYERHFDDFFGSNIRELLFEQLTPTTGIMLKTQVENVLSIFEPRITLLDVIVNVNDDRNGFSVEIQFTMNKNPENVLVVSLFLERLG